MDAATCLASGQCITITNTQWYIFIGIFALAGFLLLLLFFIAFWTPGFTFLTAKWQKRAIIGIVNRSQIIRFMSGKLKSEGMIDVKGSGPYMMTENSHTMERKSNIPLFFAFGEFAATLPLRWVYVINKIKKLYGRGGIEINNVEDLGQKIGMRFNTETKRWEATQ